jgi:putative FmdB family regulatory protein
VPTYAYKCTSCDNSYETKEGFDAPARQPCPRCGAVAKRLLFAPPIVFKGSGFYITDSRKGSSATIGAEGSGGGTPSSSSTPATSDSGSSSGGDSKPAAAAASSSDD